MIFASTLPGYGEAMAAQLRKLPHTQVILALLRDGFHPQSPGGRVQLRSDGSPTIDYPLNDFVMEGARRALLSMAEIQFAAGAREVLPVHELAQPYASWQQARAAVQNLPMKPLLAKLVSAHVMGGCWMSDDPKKGVTRSVDGQLHDLPGVHVIDGSLFPTSLGVNPQLSIYGLARLLATRLASDWKKA